MAEIEKLNLPSEVHDSDWHDDVDYAIYGENEKSEREYISPDKVSKVSIEKIKELDLTKKFKKRGTFALEAALKV